MSYIDMLASQGHPVPYSLKGMNFLGQNAQRYMIFTLLKTPVETHS